MPDISISHLFILMALHSFFTTLQYAYDVILVPCCVNSTISTPFLSQKTVAVRFMAFKQHLFKLLWVVW
jgi:hypothetical protein